MLKASIHMYHCPVGWECRVHKLLLSREVRPLPANDCSIYDAKHADDEVPVMMELWGMRSTPLLPFKASIHMYHCPIGWECRVHQLLLNRG